ncbi:hypothetical protein CEXT_710271 [Caerostris extrusa]|uniref:Uncharacterized protein n=1 Tax=Caerostris extrusa TaxID=172846 RepID=A0AAV4NYH3_CAEEX|nr:hypothetical protein CEXT_710271 [Caerostris extrusa]
MVTLILSGGASIAGEKDECREVTQDINETVRKSRKAQNADWTIPFGLLPAVLGDQYRSHVVSRFKQIQ